jgi:hypothetical protein
VAFYKSPLGAGYHFLPIRLAVHSLEALSYFTFQDRSIRVGSVGFGTARTKEDRKGVPSVVFVLVVVAILHNVLLGIFWAGCLHKKRKNFL